MNNSHLDQHADNVSGFPAVACTPQRIPEVLYSHAAKVCSSWHDKNLKKGSVVITCDTENSRRIVIIMINNDNYVPCERFTFASRNHMQEMSHSQEVTCY